MAAQIEGRPVTLVGFYRQHERVFMVGDAILSKNGSGPPLTFLPFNATRSFASNSEILRVITDLKQKIVLLSKTAAIVWTDSYVMASGIIRSLRHEFREGDDLEQKVRSILMEYFEDDRKSIALTGMQLFSGEKDVHVRAFGIDQAQSFNRYSSSFGDFVLSGTGSETFLDLFTTYLTEYCKIPGWARQGSRKRGSITV